LQGICEQPNLGGFAAPFNPFECYEAHYGFSAA